MGQRRVHGGDRSTMKRAADEGSPPEDQPKDSVKRSKLEGFGEQAISIDPNRFDYLKPFLEASDDDLEPMQKSVIKFFDKVFAAVPAVEDGATPNALARAMEAAMSEACPPAGSKEYKAKFKTLSFNLKKNVSLCEQMLSGAETPTEVCKLSVKDLASDDKKARLKQLHEEALKNASMPVVPTDTTDQWQCDKCGEKKCTYYQLQTRSADEPMTTFITCQNCGNNWKDWEVDHENQISNLV